MKKIKQKSGFTLIELLVVSTIIIILSAIGLVSFTNAGKSARNAKRKSDIEAVRQALVLLKSDTGSYPTGNGTNAAYQTVVTTNLSGYISSPTPVDPKSPATDCGPSGGVACNYTYTGTATTFTLSAPLEGTTTYLVSNP